MQIELNQPLNDEDQDKPGQASYQPTDEDQKTIKMVNEMFKKAKKSRQKYDGNWADFYSYFRGKQWKGNRPSYKHTEVINLVWQHIQSIIPIITDSKPTFDFIGDEPSDTEFAEILSQMASSDWDKGGWLFKLTELLYDSHIYGTAISEMCYDPEAFNGTGAAVLKTIDPFWFFPDPDAESLKDKGEHYITAEPVALKKLKKKWPDHAEFLKADLIDLMKDSANDFDNPRMRSIANTGTVIDTDGGYDQASKEKGLEITVYMRDYTTETVEEPFTTQVPAVDPLTGQPAIDPTTGQPAMQDVQQTRTVTKLKYPNGRKIVVCGDVLCSDGEYPYDDEGDFHPFSRLVNYVDPRSFYGISEVEPVKAPQDMFNRILSYAMDCFVLMGNPIWIIDDTSGVDEENLVNRQGLIVTKAANSEVRREAGVQINPDLFSLLDRVRTWFNDESGSQDISRGAKPDGVTAASAIQSLQEAAQTRLRLKSRNLDDFLQSLGQKWRNRTMQFTSVPKAYRTTNNQNVQKYFKFHVEQSDDGSKVAHIRDFVQNPDTGKYSAALETRQYVLNGYLDTKASTGSSLPFAKTEKANLAFQLFDRQAIDQEELLTAVDYPNKDRVLQRMQQQAMMAQQAQAMQQAPPSGEQPPPGTGQAPPIGA